MEVTDWETLQDCVANGAEPPATAFTDDAGGYERKPFDENGVQHAVSKYGNGAAHTNGTEAFSSMPERAHKGTFHAINPKHLHR